MAHKAHKFLWFRIFIAAMAVRFVGWLQSGDRRKNKPKAARLKARMKTTYLVKKYLWAAETVEQKEITTENPETIWQFWDNPTGKTTPEIVKACLKSTEQFAGDFNHKILNNSTLGNYSDLPGYVFDRLHNGQMSYAQFSDLLRLNLLKNHGGIWLDATLYVTNYIPEYIIKEDFFAFLIAEQTRYQYSFATTFLATCLLRAKKGSFLCEAWYNMCVEYWKKETELLDYYQVHFMFKALVEQNLTAKELFAKMPHIPEDELSLFIGENIVQPFNAEKWEEIKKTSFIQKTTYRIPHREDYSGTFFQKLCEGGL
jgi:hypothetical protein